MKKKAIYVNVKPEIIKWGIDSAGFKYSEISKKLGGKENLIDDWLSGKSKPTLKQLEKLTTLIKRPLASLFLSKVPEEKSLPKDFRMISGKDNKFEKKTIFAIRRARSLQRISKELSNFINEEIKINIEKVDISKDPKEISLFYRKLFDLTEDKQKKFKNHYKFYNYLRTTFEKFNIFPFQISMPLEDARGFTLIDDTPAVIVVNSKDIIDARIFTLMHEFGHVLLGETGIDIPELDSNNKIEKWCNKFSSNFLLPEEIAKRIFEENKDSLIKNETLNFLSNKYKVSKTMLLYNMLQYGYINENLFGEILNRYKSTVLVGEKKSSNIPIETKRISEMGNKFISLVADNLEKKNITYSDALGYLSIKSLKLNKLLNKQKND
ncbi:MAG: ImmA/IrrE family metallo-endopeptidase [Nanoarchaeota archaeon]|nr:ImmA/IrrE family metallo-endopeptidase [Nanoarchaeota archaeon]